MQKPSDIANEASELEAGKHAPQETIELTEQQLDNVAGGVESVTFEYSALQVRYVPQSPTGNSK